MRHKMQGIGLTSSRDCLPSLVSVGFAAQIVDANWILFIAWPSPEEWVEISLLLVGISMVVGSWEGYFSSINERPLERVFRFVIDVLIVFLYLILLNSISEFRAFKFWMAIIFTFYVVWDFVSMMEHPQSYANGGANIKRYETVLYSFGALFGRPSDNYPKFSGKASTLLWSSYFWLLVLCHDWSSPGMQLNYALFALLGSVLFRLDKASFRFGGTVDPPPWKASTRFLILFFLFAGSFAYPCALEIVIDLGSKQ